MSPKVGNAGIVFACPFEMTVQLTGAGLIVSVVILTLMITPIMTALITDALESVPRAWHEGAVALGLNPLRATVAVSLRAIASTGTPIERVREGKFKLRLDAARRDTVRGYVIRTGGRVLDPSTECFIVELLGSEAEINGFMRNLATQAELVEVVRSGALGISRELRALRLVE